MQETLPRPELSALVPALAALKSSGAHRFDPMRFCYLESLANSASSHRPGVNKILEQKALDALDNYRAEFAAARKVAAATVASVSATHPQSAVEMQQLFSDCEFRKIGNLASRLERSNTRSHLRLLSGELSGPKNPGDSAEHSPSLEDILLQQEHSAVDSLPQISVQPELSPHTQAGELKSLRRFRQSEAKIRADALVAQAIAECPEDSGPLNPHKLVIRSLGAMRDLSPQYLNRFVALIDTVTWLEQLGKNRKTASPDKTAVARKSKRTRR